MPGSVVLTPSITLKSGSSVPLGTTFQTMAGFGATFRAFTHTDMWWTNGVGPAAPVSLTTAQENAIHDLLYLTSGIGLTRARHTEPTTNPLGGVRAYSVQATDGGAFDFSGPRVDDNAAYVAKAQARGVLCTWSPQRKEEWMSNLNSTTPPATDVTKWVNWQKAIIQRHATQGAPLNAISIMNEPDFAGNMSKEFTLLALKELLPQLAAAGLTTNVLLPNSNKTSTGKLFVDYVMADPIAAPYVKGLLTHLYDESMTNIADMQSRAVTYGLPLYMGEVSTTSLDSTPDYDSTTDLKWAEAVHTLITTYNAAAVSYMMGAFGSQEAYSLISLAYTSGGTYNGATIKKSGRYMGQFAKFIRPGDIRVSVSSSDTNARVSAYWRSNGTRVIVAVNTTASPITTTLTAADLQGVFTLNPTRTSNSDDWASLASVNVTGTTASVTLQANSVTTFVGTVGA